MIRTYSELISLSTFEDRFRYLKIQNSVGEETFASQRWLNQKFYKSKIWQQIRNAVIIRDNGCDLGIEDRPIINKLYIHHINPITINDILEQTDMLLNPEYLITVSHETHNAIHYGDISLLLPSKINLRAKNDTSPWRKNT